MTSEATLHGTIERILFQNPENGYTVGVLLVQKDTVTFTGYLPGTRPGQSVTIIGSWTMHPKFGKQFQIKEISQQLPTSIHGLRAYLSSGTIKGIGKTYADRLITHFGTHVLDIIDKTPEKLRSVPGIGEKRIEQIIHGWQEHKTLAQIMVCLQEHGISATYARRIYKQYGTQAYNIVQNEPYRLAQEVWGIGFTTADKIARQTGIQPYAQARIQAAIVHVLQTLSGQGHLYATYDDVVQHVITLLNTPAEQSESCIIQAIETLCITHTLVNIQMHNMRYLSLSSHIGSEKAAARLIKQLLCAQVKITSTQIASTTTSTILSTEQQTAINLCMQHPVTIVTGGPGTGKTTLVKELIERAKLSHMRYQLAAPTGRAAKRLTQSTGSHAATIHRLLEFDPGTRTFKRNEQRALPVDMLIIDEASMLDIFLMHSLLKAVPTGSRLVFIGDIDQLPSVGPGNVLRDLITSEIIPCTRLTHIFRQSQQSLITLNAHRINQGEKFLYPSKGVASDFLFINRKDPTEIINDLEHIITRILPRYNIGTDDLMILSPMHKGALGTTILNQHLQKIMNPSSHIQRIMVHGTMLSPHDRVMQIRNNYDKMVFNGDIGTIQSIDTEIPHIIVDFDGTLVTYESTEFEELTLAYAQSIHKSQGSEYAAIVIIMCMHHYTLLARNLLYTALTRAKKLAICIGDPRAYYCAINNNQQKSRITFLSKYLQES